MKENKEEIRERRKEQKLREKNANIPSVKEDRKTSRREGREMEERKVYQAQVHISYDECYYVYPKSRIKINR